MGRVTGGIGSLREEILFMPERLGGVGLTSARHAVWSGAYMVGVRTAIIQLSTPKLKGRPVVVEDGLRE
jgi:hypothetical protein